MKRRAELALVLVTLIWGTTFTIVHQAVSTIPPLALIFLRFGLAALGVVPLLWQRRSATLGRRGIAIGIGLGALLFVGFATQTLGLARTSPSRAGFITGLNVVLVPLFGYFWRERPTGKVLVGVALAVLGLVVLTGGCRIPGAGCTVTALGSGWNWGDTLVLLCAVAFAFHIVAVGRWARGLPVVALNAVQLTTVAALAAIGTVASPAFDWGRPSIWLAAAFLGLVATGLVFGLQLWAQHWVDSTRTALIFALEPVFAALFAWWWIGEQPTLALWIGGMMMVLGIVITELPLGAIGLSGRRAESQG